MKKNIITIILLLSALFSANAQGKVYCELLGTQALLSKKVTVQVDFGQQTKFFSDNRLVDDKGNVMVFNSMVDAMNYMGTMGWEFEQAYVVTLGAGGAATNVYHWLLSKFVGEDGDSDTLKTKDIITREQKAAQQAQETEQVKEPEQVQVENVNE